MMGKGAHGLYSVLEGDESLTFSGRSQSNGREWAGYYQLRTTEASIHLSKCESTSRHVKPPLYM
jgi:hypothetical protein